MSYEVKDLDPVKELSPTRKRIEFGVAFAIMFLIVRFGGWHHDMDPLGYPVHPPTWVALAIAAAAGTVYLLWRVWYAAYSAAPRE
ncbi:MAG TPA: hypothetical protein VGB94_00820 [Acidobacteriaceae bacterium]